MDGLDEVRFVDRLLGYFCFLIDTVLSLIISQKIIPQKML